MHDLISVPQRQLQKNSNKHGWKYAAVQVIVNGLSVQILSCSDLCEAFALDFATERPAK